MGSIYTAICLINASRNAFLRELKQGDEYLAARHVREMSVRGIENRAQEVKAEIAAEEARAKPDVARLARLRKIDKLLANTLAKCR